MYGVPDKLEVLRDFRGTRLVAADQLENIVYFRFTKDGSPGRLEIGVEGEWQVRALSGETVAHGSPLIETGTLNSVLDSLVTATETRPPQSIALHFESGHVLEIFDSSEDYESFSIPHGNVYI